MDYPDLGLKSIWLGGCSTHADCSGDCEADLKGQAIDGAVPMDWLAQLN